MEINRRGPLSINLGSVERVRQDLAGLLSLLVFLVVTAALFRSWEFALLVTASLGFHELGHAFALAWLRLDFRIHFSVLGAYTWSYLPERENLTQQKNTMVHLAGPLFSLLLALLALALHHLWLPDSRHLLLLANFSAQVGFVNLLPLGPLTDGGKAIRRMAQSARSQRDRLGLLLLGAAAVIGPLVGLAWPVVRAGASALPPAALGLLLMGAWLVAGLWIELHRPRGAGEAALPRARPMKPRQLALAAVLMWDMLAAMLMVILSTPFWLEQRYLLGSLHNLELLLTWLVGLITA